MGRQNRYWGAHQHARLGVERAGAARVDNHLDVASPVRGEKSEAERHDRMLNFLVGLRQSATALNRSS